MENEKTVLTVSKSVLDEQVKKANEVAQTIDIASIPILLVHSMLGKPVIPLAGVPEKFVTNQSPTDGKSSVKGLVLSKENIISIKRYVSRGLKLPLDEGNIKTYLGYEKAPSEKLSVAEFKKYFNNIHAHAALWSDLESEIKSLGTTLNIFSEKFTTTADTVVEAINQMPIMEKLKKVGEASHVEIKFESDDNKIKIALADLLKDLQTSVKERLNRSGKLCDRIDAYRKTMDNDIVPQSNAIYYAAKEVDLKPEEKQLLENINNLEKVIKSLEKQYSELCGYCFTGAAGLVLGPIGIISWAITGGIYGSKAEEIRKTMDKRKGELKSKQIEFKSFTQLQTKTEELKNHLGDMTTIVGDAATGIQHLNDMWKAIDQYIDSSNQELKVMDNGTRLILFKSKMESASESWRQVGDMTTELVKMFDEATEAAKKEE